MNGRRTTYAGRVQGVGFRWKIRALAAGYEVRGSVRNTDEGGVELLVHGDHLEVEAFLEAIRTSDLAGLISSESSEEACLPPGSRGFHIVV